MRLMKPIAAWTKELDLLVAGLGASNDNYINGAEVDELIRAVEADLALRRIGVRVALFTLIQVTPKVLEIRA